WSSPDAQAAWKTYARLHTRLQPYFLALAKSAHETGVPAIRHVFLEHPDRPDLASVDDEFYLGPSLLVAPVVKRGARTRDLHIPFFAYLDWTDQAEIRSIGTATVSAPLAKLPLFIREGSIVPLLDPRIDTL